MTTTDTKIRAISPFTKEDINNVNIGTNGINMRIQRPIQMNFMANDKPKNKVNPPKASIERANNNNPLTINL